MGREEEAGSRSVRASRYIWSLTERIAHYRLVRKLGQGGMGEVYRAVDERLGRSVAVKLLPPGAGGDERSQARLVREAQAASNLNHPGIVTVHDVGIWDDRVYFVMELVEGERFSELVRRGIEPSRAIALCAQAAEALAVAHRRGILHRDIKPDNLMVTEEGRVKVLDFGLAKLRAATDADELEPVASLSNRSSLEALLPTVAPTPTPTPTPPPRPSRPGTADTIASSGDDPKPWPSSRSSDPSLTEADTLLGTPLYMSPEQASRKPVDARSEIYSLGLVLYELLTRRRPLARETLYETLAAATAADLPPIEPGPKMPRALVPILKRALARDPEARYQDMTELARALAGVDTKRSRSRWPWLVAGGAVGAAAIATVAVIATRDEPPARRRFTVAASNPITAEPGCEEFPSFTPDGREIVFDGMYQGDYEIQAIPVGGGTARVLTHTPGWDIGAEVSPDGRHVAYVHFGAQSRELRIVSIDGDGAAPPRVVGAIRGFPIWSRDGAVLYGDDGGMVWRAPLDGKPVVLARLPKDHIAPYLDQYRDGELVVSTKSRANAGSSTQIGHARAGELVRLASPTWEANDSAHIRVDDELDGLFFVKHVNSGARKIHWRPRRGGEEVVLEGIEDVPNSFAISPRRDRLVYSSCNTQTAVGRIEAGKFSPLPVLSGGWDADELVVLDAEHVIIASKRSGSASRLWRVSTAGKAELLVDQAAAEPAVSPNRALLAWRGLVGGAPGVYIRGLSGGAITRLSDGTDDGYPRFSHDSRHVYFLRSEPSGVRLHAVPVGGGEPTPITPPGVVAYAASPTADRIAIVTSDGDGRTVAVGPAKGPYRAVTNIEQRAYAYVTFTADGNKLLISPDPATLLEIDPGSVAPPRTIYSSTHETLHQFLGTPDGVWALVSSDEGDVVVVDGRF